jgi:methionyl-tRNA formyltransferase
MKASTTRPRILLCLDNRVGYGCLQYLIAESSLEVCGAVVHPRATALYADEIAEACRDAGIPLFEYPQARAHFEEIIAPLAPDYLACFYFDYVLDDRFASLPKLDAINLHPGYQPDKKGFFHYVWSVLDGTPAGVCLHRMNSAELYAQADVPVTPEDTGDVLYTKHEDAAIALFRATLPSILSGKYRSHAPGSRHAPAEPPDRLRLDPDERVRARELIDRLRSSSAPVIELDGATYRVELTLKAVPKGFVPKPPGKSEA